ncbi:RagB/SusD family nutrient uptake outer membrane protein [Chitinophaga sp. MM2321]|uniref:RagB/SusD family nutrient uptake outer membrane protein n=1 Tax=Chitinophaga sp. MM2321 TaxID=3137178 RepID=UPI0032D59791
MKIINNHILFILLSAILFTGCKKFVSVDTPINSISDENAFNDDNTAAALLNGIYTDLSYGDNFSTVTNTSVAAISILPGLSSDELSLWPGVTNTTLLGYYKNDLRAITLGSNHYWNKLYYTIFLSNFAINGLSTTTKLTPSIKQQLLGEALFVRSFCYFYLINLYGDVPFTVENKYEITASLKRTSMAEIYQQLIKDLLSAENLLNSNYLDAHGNAISYERIRPNKAAAKALLARIYLYTEDYPNAELKANDIIENKYMYDTVSLNNVFLKNSKEAIWQLPSVNGTTSQNTGEGRLFILPQTGPSSSLPMFINQNLLDAFENEDLRKSNWTKQITVSDKVYTYPYKYKIGKVNTPTSEYLMILRTGEQYLIRAEAKAKQNKLDQAKSDLNVIRRRAGLQPTTAKLQQQILVAIAHERQVELFTEWGHRWLDLKRTGQINEVMSKVTLEKGGTWDSKWALYPIPAQEISLDPNLKQNPGYE